MCLLHFYILSEVTEGEQNMSPQNVSLQHIDYFELKSIKTQQTSEKHLALSYLPKRNSVGDLAWEESYD